MDLKNNTIVVWFSCGAASAVAAKKTVEKYGATNNILIVNNPVAEEHEDNQRFLKDVEKWIGLPIIQATNTETKRVMLLALESALLIDPKTL